MVQRLQVLVKLQTLEQITVIVETPDGLNINLNVGSTHPETLQEVVKKASQLVWLAAEQ